MTFEEVAQVLPNGFHDAKLRRLEVDFAARSITIGMALLVGVPNTVSPEAYRSGTLEVLAPVLFFVEPPDPHYPFALNGSLLNVDGDSVKLGQDTNLDSLLSILPKDSVAYRFFLDEWNSFLYVAGASVEFSWDE